MDTPIYRLGIANPRHAFLAGKIAALANGATLRALELDRRQQRKLAASLRHARGKFLTAIADDLAAAGYDAELCTEPQIQPAESADGDFSVMVEWRRARPPARLSLLSHVSERLILPTEYELHWTKRPGQSPIHVDSSISITQVHCARLIADLCAEIGEWPQRHQGTAAEDWRVLRQAISQFLDAYRQEEPTPLPASGRLMSAQNWQKANARLGNSEDRHRVACAWVATELEQALTRAMNEEKGPRARWRSLLDTLIERSDRQQAQINQIATTLIQSQADDPEQEAGPAFRWMAAI